VHESLHGCSFRECMNYYKDVLFLEQGIYCRFVCLRESARARVCVCLCEGLCLCLCAKAREGVCLCVCVCACVCVHVGMRACA